VQESNLKKEASRILVLQVLKILILEVVVDSIESVPEMMNECIMWRRGGIGDKKLV
jgi:hypothetical protein